MNTSSRSPRRSNAVAGLSVVDQFVDGIDHVGTVDWLISSEAEIFEARHHVVERCSLLLLGQVILFAGFITSSEQGKSFQDLGTECRGIGVLRAGQGGQEV